MTLTPDALQLGPLVLAWDRLALLLAAGVWLGTAGFRHAGGALLFTLLAARLAATLPHWSELAPTLGGRVLSVLDLRAGGWAWPAGLLAGAGYLLLRLRRWPPALTRSLLLTPQGEVTPVTFAELPRPAVVNVWATWCGPCRAELPVLARALQAGEPVLLVNAGEEPAQVRAFLKSVGAPQVTFVDNGSLRQTWQVSGYPSTFVLDRTGRVTARHLGPLNAPQLQTLLDRAKEPSP
ncbi:TlpA disulfide reductase family protein [Deinococcus aluminii]|uniref:Thiol-disulfide oxidoreductase ResA n=1 Tax=Deinococcus aluminii TaxID=1656885 RepID=A0ABP9XFB8_9DEIO